MPVNSPGNTLASMFDSGSAEAGFISRIAFDDACQAFRYCPGLSSGAINVEIRRHGDHHYLRVIRPLSISFDPPIQPDSIKRSHVTHHPNDNHESSTIEEEDAIDDFEQDPTLSALSAEDVAIYHSPPSQTVARVEYHILHSTSYRVPVLYFFLHTLSSSIPQSIDTVYGHLVPKHLRSEVKNVGVMGGIGLVNHPLTDIPCFWVHPCNSAEAMRSVLHGINKDISPLEYLMLWVGLVGSTVGLSLPKKMVRSG